jgi:hypothetical protein
MENESTKQSVGDLASPMHMAKLSMSTYAVKYRTFLKILGLMESDPEKGLDLYREFSSATKKNISKQKLKLTEESLRSGVVHFATVFFEAISSICMVVQTTLMAAKETINSVETEEFFNDFDKRSEDLKEAGVISADLLISYVTFVETVSPTNILKQCIEQTLNRESIANLTAKLNEIIVAEPNDVYDAQYFELIMSTPWIDAIMKVAAPISMIGMDDSTIFTDNLIKALVKSKDVEPYELDTLFKAIELVAMSLSMMATCTDSICAVVKNRLG